MFVVGLKVGAGVGFEVGKGVGLNVGAAVGFSVGVGVGFEVGAGVGLEVGAGVLVENGDAVSDGHEPIHRKPLAPTQNCLNMHPRVNSTVLHRKRRSYILLSPYKPLDI